MMEVKTPEEFFETQLPKRFKPENAAGIDSIIQISLSGGKKEQDWVVTIKNQKLQVTKGTNSSNSLSLRITESDFLDMINGKLNAEKALFTGRIRFQGNIGLALKLRDAGLF
jgi:putative sterol carrier protein